MSKKNILIISYVFPPYPGIGGRRWAKFAKYLHKKGHNVYVVAAKNPFKNTSTFINDISEIPKENLFYLSPKYPTIILQQPINFQEKLQYNFWVRILPLFTEGNYYDRSMFWKNQLHQTVKKIIKEKNINTIIVTGPPFHLAYLTVLLKKDFPNVNFIADYRDEWTFNDVHGWGTISEKRKEKEIEKEKFVCENADVIISPTESILEYLINKYKIKNYREIPHAFDKDDFNGIQIKENKNFSDNIIISYFGTVQDNTGKFFIELNTFLDFLKAEHPSLYNHLFFNFCLISHFPFVSLISRHINKFQFYYNIPSNELFNKINESHFVILMLSERAKDYFTSKYPEIFYLKKAIILYSNEGKVSQFIKDKNIGVHLAKENFNNELLAALQNPQQYHYENFNIGEWDYEFVTTKLEKLIFSV